MTSMPSASYRPCLDGLRAIAVLSVMAFHFGEYLSGGFIGVDIFFVISGYLITQIILRSLTQGTFSFKDFYIRRIKRILPAFYGVCFIAMFAGYFILSPYDYKSNAEALIASVLNISNFYFWKTASYFDSGNEYKLFLHTWSLSVEEQFYWVFPLGLWGMHRFLPQFKPLFFILTLVFTSLCVSLWIQNEKPSANFYLLITRIWELGAGAFLASIFVGKYFSDKILRFLGTIGIISIGFLACFYHKEMIFPGMTAIPIIIATGCLIISSETDSWVNKTLSTPALVWIGKISYSLYLWHWVVFIGVSLTMPEGIAAIVTMVILTFIMAIFSYYCIETPCRFAKGKKERYVLYGCGITTLVLISMGFYLSYHKGIMSRFDSQTQTYFSARFEVIPKSPTKACSQELTAINDVTQCRFGDVNLKKHPKTILWGDSYAGSLLTGFNRYNAQNPTDILVRSFENCIPTTGKIYSTRALCGAINQKMITFIQQQKFDKIILVGRFAAYYNDNPDYRFRKNIYDKNGKYTYLAGQNIFAKDMQQLVQTLKESAKDVYVIDTVPISPFMVPDYLARKNFLDFGRNQSLEKTRLTRDDYLRNNHAFRALMKKIDNIHFLEIDSFLCPKGNRFCPLSDPITHEPYYQDKDHLTRTGSLKLMPLYKKIFKEY